MIAVGAELLQQHVQAALLVERGGEYNDGQERADPEQDRCLSRESSQQLAKGPDEAVREGLAADLAAMKPR